jgi:phosphatidylglycerophosphate synthase
MTAVQKPSRGAPPYSVWVNRRAGRLIAAAAYLGGLTPNAVTGISALLTFCGLALVALVPPMWWLGLVVAALLALGYAFDSADGQLARLRGGGSLRGEWLDHMVDVTKTCLVHIAVLVSFFRFGHPGGRAFLLVPLGYLTVSVVFFFGIMLTDQLRRSRPARVAAPAGRGVLQTLVALPADYGILCIAFLLVGWRPGFVVVYCVLFAAHTLVLVAGLVKWYRDLRRLDRADGS